MSRTKATRLKQRANGIWYIVWPGNRTGRSTRTGDRAVAEAALAAFLQERDADSLTAETLLTGTAIDHYMDEHVRNRSRAGAPVEGVETAEIAAKFLKAHFANIPVARIAPSDVNDYIIARRSGRIAGTLRNGAPSKPPGDWKLRRELGVLIAAINHETTACEPGSARPRLSKNDVRLIPLPAEPPPKDRWLTDDERISLLQATPHTQARTETDGKTKREVLTRIYRFVWLALETAARRRAIETLTWFQVDMERRIINYNPAGRRATKKRRGIVPISDELLVVLQRAKQEATNEYVLDHPGSVKKAFGGAVKAAKLRGVTPHTCRHTWATRAAQSGVSMFDIAGVLADDEATVRKRYAHHSPDYLRDAVNFRRPVVAKADKEEKDG